VLYLTVKRRELQSAYFHPDKRGHLILILLKVLRRVLLLVYKDEDLRRGLVSRLTPAVT
jgi:hypothetical protein